MKKLFLILGLFIGLAASAQDSVFVFRDQIMMYGDSIMVSAVSTPIANPDTFNINWENGSYAESGWVSLINNIQTPYTIDGSMTITAQGSYPATTSGDTGGSTVPDNVAQTAHYGDCDWVIANVPSTYDSVAVSIFASRGSTSDNRTGEYSFEGTMQSFNSASNTDTWLDYDFIARPSDGEILIEMDIASGSAGAYINGMYIILK